MTNPSPRHIALDTETTGFGAKANKIIEIGALEFDPETGMPTGKTFHTRLNPNMEIHPRATAVHGMKLKDLQHEPLFSHVAEDFLNFIQGSHLVIHNAPFDVSFLDSELSRVNAKPLAHSIASITDTLKMVKTHLSLESYNLDSVADHFGVDRSSRQKHGALIDCEILAMVYPHVQRAANPNKETRKEVDLKALTSQSSQEQIELAKIAKSVICQMSSVKDGIKELIPFDLGENIDSMGLDTAASRQILLAGITSMIEKEQKRYTERVRSLTNQKSMTSDVCTVAFSERNGVNWEAIVKEKLPDLDTKPYEKKTLIMKIIPSANVIVAEATQSEVSPLKPNRP